MARRTGTIDRQSRSERPTTVECANGQRWAGEWDSEFAFIAIESGDMPEAVKVEIEAALDEAMRRLS